jgi:hypothetical protein
MVSRWAMTKAVRPSRRRSMLLLTTRSASLSGALVASSKIQTGGSRVDRYALRLAAGDATSRTRRCGFGSRAIGFTCEEPSGPRDRLARIPPSAFRPSCVRSSLSQTRDRSHRDPDLHAVAARAKRPRPPHNRYRRGAPTRPATRRLPQWTTSGCVLRGPVSGRAGVRTVRVCNATP